MTGYQEDALIGREIDGYRILGVLGRGGMGIVYEAEDVALSRTVALKIIDPALARDAAFVRRFRTEARALASVQSLYIVNVFALRQTEVGILIVMEYVDGGTVADLIDEGPIGWERAYPISRQMLQAFEQAHSVGVIHRDIKPRNIMLSRDGTVKVTDFGLAKLRQADKASTVTQGTAGTLFYMSPEQIKGLHDLDHRSDIYSIGMTIYEMFAGRLPFDRDANDFTIMRTIVENKFPPPTQFRPEIPSTVARIVMKALEKDPARRYKNAGELREALEATHEREGDALRTRLVERRGRRRMIVASAATVVVLALAIGYVLFDRNPIDAVPGGAAIFPSSSDTSQISGQTPVDSSALVASPGQASNPATSHNTAASQDPPDASVDAETSAGAAAASEDDPTPAARPASVTLTAGEAGVEIEANGVSRRGRSTVRLSPGSHEITFRHPVYGERREQISVQAGERVSLTYYFTGQVSIPAPLLESGEEGPWAAIWIDGQTESDWFTPKTIELGPGHHVVSLTKSDYNVLNNEQQIEITPGFERPEHSLVFRMRPD